MSERKGENRRGEERGKGESPAGFYTGTKKMKRKPQVNRRRRRRRSDMNRGSECLPKAGQCVNVADLVTPGLPLLTCLPREAINKEIMAKQFTQRLWLSLMPFKCANHFFPLQYSERERERGRCERQTMLEKDREHVQIVYSPMVQ